MYICNCNIRLFVHICGLLYNKNMGRTVIRIEKCRNCQKDFNVTAYNAKQIFCNISCKNDKYKPIELTCVVCNSSFTRKPYDIKCNNNYCSKSCSNKNRKRIKKDPKKCLVCENYTKKNATKYCSSKCMAEYESGKRWEQLNNSKVNYSDRTLKLLLIRYTDYKCSNCFNTTWMGQQIPLELEHKDGDYSNNTIKNLALLCPNCHSLTTTYKGKNRGRGRYKRRLRYSQGKSY